MMETHKLNKKLNEESHYVPSFKWFLETVFRILVSKKIKRSWVKYIIEMWQCEIPTDFCQV